jgi:hypothetical protein
LRGAFSGENTSPQVHLGSRDLLAGLWTGTAAVHFTA